MSTETTAAALSSSSPDDGRPGRVDLGLRRRGALSESAAVAAALSEHVASLTRLLALVSGGTASPAGPPAEELLTYEDVAAVLQCSPKKAREWVLSYVQVVLIGDLVRVRRVDLDVAVRRMAAPYGER